jgi:biopolymer transport protein ExbD
MNLGQRNQISVSAGMASMTDLVFLLLIFFIILSTLAKHGHEVDLPTSKGATGEKTPVILTIDKDLVYYIDKNMVNKEDVEQRLQIVLENKAEKTIMLNVDKDVPTGETVEMIGLAKVNQWKVVIASQRANETE